MAPSVVVVCAQFNEFITSHLLEGALTQLAEAGYGRDQVEVIKVPGAFEIPQAVGQLVRLKHYKAIICLGAIIKGETSHYDYICHAYTDGIASLSRRSLMPIINGVLTTDNADQSLARCGIKGPNLGREAAKTALKMVSVFKYIQNKNGEPRRHEGASIISDA